MTGPGVLPRSLVVGLGSPDRGDDAVGPAVARRVALHLPGLPVVEREDPTSLIDLWHGQHGTVELAIIVDAVRSGRAPGTLMIIETGCHACPLPEQAWARTGRGGTHAFGLAESVELARALRRLPERVVLVGIEASTFDHGAPLSAPVAAAVGRAVDAVTALVTAGPVEGRQEVPADVSG